MFDFYHIDHLAGDPGSLLPKLLPVGTLVLGIFLNRWFQRADKRREGKKATHDLLTEIELLETPMAKQEVYVNTFIEHLNSDKDEVPKFTGILLLKLDRLSILDRSGVVDHLERQLGSRRAAIDKANELFIGCDAITLRYGQLREFVDHYIQQRSQIHERWREEANGLLRLIQSLGVDVHQQGKDPLEDPLIGSALAICKASVEAQRDIFSAYEDLHKPLTHLLSEHLTDERFKELSAANAKAVGSVQELQRERKYAVLKLGQVRDKMAAQYKRLLGHAQSIGEKK